MERLPLSVVVGTVGGWPHVADTINAIRHDAEKLGAEIIVADGSGAPPPHQAELGPSVRWLQWQRDSVFELYALGLREARGEVIATTEDHAVPRPGWLAAIIRAHAEQPEAAVIGGAIENGTRDRLIAWASYFCTQALHMAPLGNRRVRMTTNEANVSYKRWAIDDFDDHAGLGFMAISHNRALAERGAILWDDDRFAVDHLELKGFWEQTIIHFHNGRSISGFIRARGMRLDDWIRLGAGMLLPAVRSARFVRNGLTKRRHRRELLTSAPLIAWLEYAQGVGHVVGYALGPGDSPRHLR